MIAMSDTQDSLQGTSIDLSNLDQAKEALDKAFDYRGDVTVQLRDGSTINGYIYDRHPGANLDDSLVRIMPADGSANRSIAYAEITSLAFTGKDAAHGKSWENWLKRYAEKRAKGESADLLPEPLDE